MNSFNDRAVTGKLLREKDGPRDHYSIKFWSGGPIFSWKIGPPLIIWVLQWTNFPWNVGPGDHFFQGLLVRETKFFMNIGPGDHFFRENWSGRPFLQGKLVRETIFFMEFWSTRTNFFHGKLVLS